MLMYIYALHLSICHLFLFMIIFSLSLFSLSLSVILYVKSSVIFKGELFGCVADIGWITGHSYVVYGPLGTDQGCGAG